MSTETEITAEQEVALSLPISGTLAFKRLVARRDWVAVYEVANQACLTGRDWEYINSESEKDGYVR